MCIYIYIRMHARTVTLTYHHSIVLYRILIHLSTVTIQTMPHMTHLAKSPPKASLLLLERRNGQRFFVVQQTYAQGVACRELKS